MVTRFTLRRHGWSCGGISKCLPPPRGIKLVDAPDGCKRRFVCPYCDWSYDAEGRLINGPHFDKGLPDLQKQDLSLDQFAVLEQADLILLSTAKAATTKQIQANLSPVASGLKWLDMAKLKPPRNHN